MKTGLMLCLSFLHILCLGDDKGDIIILNMRARYVNRIKGFGTIRYLEVLQAIPKIKGNGLKIESTADPNVSSLRGVQGFVVQNQSIAGLQQGLETLWNVSKSPLLLP